MTHLLDSMTLWSIAIVVVDYNLNADAGQVSVTVTVTDYNDETPEFIPATLFAAVAEESVFGTTITTLRV